MKDKIITISFLVFIFAFGILGIALKDKAVSQTERRKLQQFPKFKLNSDYVVKLDKYVLDHFPFRDNFRSIKAFVNYNVLQKLSNNDIYIQDNYIFKSNYPTNYSSIQRFLNNIKTTQSFLNESNNTYIMVIPDKNYYLDSNNFLNINYEDIYNKINELDMNVIDIRSTLNLDDYYETDTHWKQENLGKVAEVLSNNMKFKYTNTGYSENVCNDFYGVYFGESAVSRKPEKLTYLTSDIILNAKVNYFENKELTTVYNEKKLTGFDAYEVFLDGASAFIEITNPNTTTNKELVIFRDSFGSSLTPLLIEGYSKITVIDNRYIRSEDYLKLIEFKEQDVLFLYSTLIVNDSGSLKN